MNAVTTHTPSSSAGGSLRESRRLATRRGVVLPCQAVRERDFTLIAERTLDISIDGLLLPVHADVATGDKLIVSLAIPGIWIDAECTVTRVVRGRRPGDEGPAIGVLFETMAPAARAALAGYLHGKPPPLPRRGPLARLRRGEDVPQLADHAVMKQTFIGPRPLASLEDIEDVVDVVEPAAVDAVEILRELASAWKRLALSCD